MPPTETPDGSDGGTLRRAVQVVYNETLRPRLPKTYGVYAGVTARDEPLLDANKRHPDYKKGFIDGIYETVQKGDTVTLIGGGRGVSTVHAMYAGASRVIVFEASREMLDVAYETVDIAGFEDAVEWRHALVGEGIDVYGKPGSPEYVAPPDLVVGDVLIMDCEGAEAGILDGLRDWPERLVVETHPEKGVDPTRLAEMLRSRGYDIERRRYEPDHSPLKQVLVGTLTQRAERVDRSREGGLTADSHTEVVVQEAGNREDVTDESDEPEGRKRAESVPQESD